MKFKEWHDRLTAVPFIPSSELQGIEMGIWNRIKGKGNGAGLAWERQSHYFADEFGITHAHSFGTDTQHDYSQGNFRTMSSMII